MDFSLLVDETGFVNMNILYIDRYRNSYFLTNNLCNPYHLFQNEEDVLHNFLQSQIDQSIHFVIKEKKYIKLAYLYK